MKLTKVLLLSLCLFMLVPQLARGQNLNSHGRLRKSDAAISDSYIVVFNDSVAPARVQAFAAQLAREHRGTLGFTYQNAVLGFSVQLSEAQAVALSHNPHVAYVEEDALVEGAATQTGATWALDRIDQRSLPLDTTYSYLNAGTGANVYVIDGGIRLTHQEFGGRALFAYDNVGDGRNGVDCNGHGTHVAGVIGGKTYGVAKDAKLWAVRVLNCLNQGTTARVLAGIDWVAANHVKPAVANLSFITVVGSDTIDLSVRKLVAAGVTTVVAAGNNTGEASLRSPARVTEAITVAASDQNDNQAPFSNYGAAVDVYAPGVDIVSASHFDDVSTSVRSGTSSAAPFVAGLAARYLAARPGDPPAAVSQAIMNTATPDRVSGLGAGSPNLLAYAGITFGDDFNDNAHDASKWNAPYTGVNLAGAEFAPDQLPGTYGTHYIYPTRAEVDYFTGKGMNVFRLPFLWERLQRTQFGDFDAAELARIDDFVNYASGRGASVVLDPHNYARYNNTVVGMGIPTSAFADFWSKLASRYKGNSRVIFGLMNEPNGMATELWRDNANAAIQAIRNAGAANLILVPGNGWTGAHSWNHTWYGTPNSQVMLGINDPGNNYAFEVHQYLDSDFSGTSDQCVSSTIGSEKLVEFTNWLRQHGKRGFLGEFAGGRNDTCAAALDNMLTYIDNNTDVWLGWTYWAAGPWWEEYIFTLEPVNGADRPQMLPLTGHFASPSGGMPPPTPASGTGLKGDYYNSISPTGAVAFTRTDATVNFDWGSDPGAGVSSDNFSVRWTGQVRPLYSETYTFYTVSDDGVRLWVNGTQVINNWADHPATENSGTITLTAGQRYDIQMEFYERSGGAVSRLSWASPTQAKQIIPASQLYPATVSQPNPPLVLDDFESGTLTKWNTFAGTGSNITGGVFAPAQSGNYAMTVSYNVADWGGIEQVFNASRNWSGYTYLDFWFYGNNSGNRFRVELYDNGTSAGLAERFEYQFVDDASGWRRFTIPLNSFTRRADWQPSGAPNDGLTLTQMWGLNFSPLGGSNSFRMDQVQLTYYS